MYSLLLLPLRSKRQPRTKSRCSFGGLHSTAAKLSPSPTCPAVCGLSSGQRTASASHSSARTRSKAQRERKKARNDEDVLDHDYHFDRLWVLDMAAHEARQLTTGDQNIDTIDWSPDGSTILSRVSPTPRLDDYWRVSKVIEFDAANGAQRRILEEVSGYQEPAYSQDGSQIVYSRFTEKRITAEHYVKTLAKTSSSKKN